VNLWMSWMSILAKKTKTPWKTQKKLKILNIKMSTGGGPAFTFSLPGGAARPFAPMSVTPLPNAVLVVRYVPDPFYSCFYTFHKRKCTEHPGRQNDMQRCFRNFFMLPRPQCPNVLKFSNNLRRKTYETSENISNI